MGLSPEQHQAVDAYLAKHAGADAPLVKALLTDGELSTGDPAATSPKGARGLMQLMPIAVKDIGLDPDTFPYDNPAENLKGGIAYVKKLREDYGFTNPLQIAAAYNAGPSAVKAAIAKGGIQFLPAETQAYVKRMHAALGQRVNAPEVSAPQDTPAPTQPQMPVMTDATDPVDYAQIPTDSVYTPPPGAVAGQAGAPIPVNSTPGAAPPGILETIAAAPVRALQGLNDAGRLVGGVMLPEAATPNAEVAANTAINQALPAAPNPQAAAGYADAAAQGATIGAVGGPGGAVAGAVTGVVSHATANFAERLGLPRIVGAVAGGLGVGAVSTAARGAGAIARTARDEAKNARRVVQELDDATMALERAQQSRNATAQAGRQMVRDAKGQRTVAQAYVENAERNVTAAIDDYLVRERNPIERAATLQRATQSNRDAVHTFVSREYDDFLQRADDSGALVPTHEIRAEAQEIIDDLVISGIPREQAAAQARAIVQVLGQPGVSFTHAQALRSSLGAYAFKAKGAARERFIRMQQEVDRAIVRALPEDMRPEFAAVRSYRRAEGRLFQNQFVKKLIADTPEGREVATAYAARLLEGDWTTEKMVGLREVRRALGNTDAGGVLQDAFLRQAMNDTRGDLGDLGRVLRSQDGLGQAARELLEPRAFQQLTELSDEVLRARRVFEMAGSNVRDVQRMAGETLEQARRRVQDAGFAKAAASRNAKGVGPGRFNPNESVLHVIGSLAWQRAASFRLLMDPQKRATLLRALRTSASSAKGQEMLRTLAISGAVGQQTPPAPATAATPAR